MGAFGWKSVVCFVQGLEGSRQYRVERRPAFPAIMMVALVGMANVDRYRSSLKWILLLGCQSEVAKVGR